MAWILGWGDILNTTRSTTQAMPSKERHVLKYVKVLPYFPQAHKEQNCLQLWKLYVWTRSEIHLAVWSFFGLQSSFCRHMFLLRNVLRWINHWIGVSRASSINFLGMISPLKSTWLKSLYNTLLGFNSIFFLNFIVQVMGRK